MPADEGAAVELATVRPTMVDIQKSAIAAMVALESAPRHTRKACCERASCFERCRMAVLGLLGGLAFGLVLYFAIDANSNGAAFPLAIFRAIVSVLLAGLAGSIGLCAGFAFPECFCCCVGRGDWSNGRCTACCASLFVLPFALTAVFAFSLPSYESGDVRAPVSILPHVWPVPSPLVAPCLARSPRRRPDRSPRSAVHRRDGAPL